MYETPKQNNYIIINKVDSQMNFNDHNLKINENENSFVKFKDLLFLQFT